MVALTFAKTIAKGYRRNGINSIDSPPETRRNVQLPAAGGSPKVPPCQARCGACDHPSGCRLVSSKTSSILPIPPGPRRASDARAPDACPHAVTKSPISGGPACLGLPRCHAVPEAGTTAAQAVPCPSELTATLCQECPPRADSTQTVTLFCAPNRDRISRTSLRRPIQQTRAEKAFKTVAKSLKML